MRLALLTNGAHTVVALEQDAQFYLWSDVIEGDPPTSILDWIISGMAYATDLSFEQVAPLDREYSLLAPLPRPPRNIICLGRNYAAHAEEQARSRGTKVHVPSAPIVFTKATTTVSAPESTIRVDPHVTKELDYEVELAVVIGKQGRRIPRMKALEHVAGYTVINDLTARDLQQRHNQWFLGKSLDGSCPMGPVLVTPDEIQDLDSITLSMRVDGELRQQASIRDMIFDVPTIIETLSAVFTLQPGDIIATGTPEGVGLGFSPPRFLQHGSVVEAHIDRIGTLRNRIEFTTTDRDDQLR